FEALPQTPPQKLFVKSFFGIFKSFVTPQTAVCGEIFKSFLFFAVGATYCEKLPKRFPKENTSFAAGKHHILLEDASFFRKAKKHRSY
ncbi:MAG: hypothetical protein IJY89_00125, partial [Clostridia bacterium]|nr:hypothetical protein [Clostridia bacterium]